MARLVIISLLFTTMITAQQLPQPNLPAKKVVQIQLSALQFNDSPSKNAGINLTWQFAHPDNREATGPLQRFTAMIQSPHYKSLLNHSSHTINKLEADEARSVFQVDVQKQSGRVLRFIWVVEKVARGTYKGCWMTTAVTAPMVIMEGI